LLWIEDELEATDMAAYVEVKQKLDNSNVLSSSEMAVLEKVEKYLLNCCSTWLEHGEGGTDAEDANPTYNPESCQFDKCHPCSKYVDVTINYGRKEDSNEGISASSKRPRYGIEATKAARDIYLAVHMHRCCPTCHK